VLPGNDNTYRIETQQMHRVVSDESSDLSFILDIVNSYSGLMVGMVRCPKMSTFPLSLLQHPSAFSSFILLRFLPSSI